MNWIKTSDKLPTIEQAYFVYLKQPNYKEYRQLHYYYEKDKDMFLRYVDRWLDETEEEITDTKRLDWLSNVDNFELTEDYWDCNNIELREFINNCIKA